MKLALTCCLLCLHIIAIGQKKKSDIPEFGIIDKSELELNECAFDKNAEAEVLFDVKEVKCNLYTYSVDTDIKRHIRIKILKDKGLDKANIQIPFLSYEGSERVTDIKANTYNLGTTGEILISRLDKKSIFKKDFNKRFSEMIFTFPGVKTGSVIEYEYTISARGVDGLGTWNFQHSIPVKLSRYIVDFPEEIEFAVNNYCTLPVFKKESKEKYRKEEQYTMTEVPPLRDEPYITCDDDYLQRINIRVTAINTLSRRINRNASWTGVVTRLMGDEDFGQQLTKNIPRTDDLDLALKKVKSEYEKMTTIYYYVQKNMAWNGYTNIWALNGVKSAWKEKKGTSGEINLILVNLLKEAGLDAHPILVSTRDNGRVNMQLAGYSQFNKVMAIVNIAEKPYVLDATDKYNSPKLIPYDVMYSDGLVIEKFETFDWGWKSLWDENQKFKDVIIILADIDSAATLTGNATINSYDYSRTRNLRDLKKDREKFIEKHFTSNIPGIKIDSFNVENEDADTLALVEHVQFRNLLTTSGNYAYFTTNLFTGLEKNLFVADTRFSDVFFGANQSYTIVASFTIPDNYILDELPKDVRMLMADTSIVFTRMSQRNENMLSLRITIDFKKPIFRVEEYPDFKEFYKKLFNFLNEQIVMRKKN